jgi:phosphoribosylpyrophosphate synthetase
MKRIALLLGTLLLLSGCAKSVEPIAGEVVSCAEINRDTSITDGVQLGCLDGGEGTYLQGLRGPMLINVWGSWCYECGIEMPYLRTFYAKAQGKVALVGVDVEEKNIFLIDDILDSGNTMKFLEDSYNIPIEPPIGNPIEILLDADRIRTRFL